jgi:predicted component of viral defense system (DUF524 family)
MSVLYYDKNDQIAIADEPFFPDEAEGMDTVFSEREVVSVEEWKTYYVRAYGEKEPAFLGKPPFYGRPFHSRIYEINFKNFVGLSRIGNIKVRVENRKISDALYDSMLSYITDKYADLIFSFNTSVGLEYTKDKAGQDILYVQFLFLKKYLLDSSPNLDEITGLIAARPHRRIKTESHKCFINEMDNFDEGLILDLFSTPEKMAALSPGHPLISSPLARVMYLRTGEYHYPSEATKIRKYHTFDTNENRFVKHFLQDISKKLDSIQNALGARPGSYLNPDISRNAGGLKTKVRYFLSDPMWTEVGQMNFVPVQSTVLQRRDGYRHLFRLYSLLQLLTRYQFLLEDFRNLIEIKDVPTLFEYWSFFLVKDIMDRKSRQKGISIIIPDTDIERVVREGVAIKYENGGTLIYNANFQGSAGASPGQTQMAVYQASESYSHALRPDIVLMKASSGKLILDAKYKGKNTPGAMYGEETTEGTIGRYKEEDLDKMHTYRDAIQDVYGAFALYPGEESVIYPSHQTSRNFKGIGALPLKPISGGKPRDQDMVRLEEAIDDFIGTP